MPLAGPTPRLTTALRTRWIRPVHYGALLAIAFAALLALPIPPASAAPATPTVTSVSPAYGTAGGGDIVTLRGTGLLGVTQVSLGDYPAASFTVISDSEIRLVTPPMSGTAKGIVLTTGTTVQTQAYTGRMFDSQDITVLPPVRALALADVAPNTVQCVTLRGRFGIPLTAGVVMLNVTTKAPSGPGNVVVYPDHYSNGGSPVPQASTVNFIPGRDVANLTMVQMLDNGQACFMTRGARSGLLLDVEGYQATAFPFNVSSPERVIDTRPAGVGLLKGRLQAKTLYTAYAGWSSVNGGGVVVANITVSGARSPGNLRAFAAGDPVPSASTTNYLPGADRATLALVRARGQEVSLYSDTSGGNDVHVMLDSLGDATTWPADLSWRASSLQLSGKRVVDTRPSTRVGPISGALQANTVYRLPVSALPGRPADSHVALLNVISSRPTSPGHLRVYTGALGAPVPNVSALNYLPGWDTSNLVFVDLATGGYINFFSGQPAGQSAHLVVDVVAYTS